MGHNLDINNGVASFADSRTDAWHALGQSGLGGMTADVALKEAHLAGWDLRKLPLSVQTEGGLYIPVPDRFAVVRNNPIIDGQVDVLGDVGKAYRIWQNEELCSLLDTLVDESGAHYETAGALDGGRKVFITMKIPSHIKIGGVDPVDLYLAIVTSHDGSMSHTLMVTPVRIVCQNTLNCAFGNHSYMFKVRHTKGSDKIMAAQARELLGMSFNYMDAFQADAEKMIQATLTQQRFEEIIAKEFGAKEGAAAATVTRAEKKLDQMAELFADSHTHEGVRSTVWAGFNALTEWADHFAPTRGDQQDEDRAVKALLDPWFKADALKLMMAQV
jgi:phage/plasmid-like protein (TIGR03299 family)